jgi:hypothetical protein
MIMLIGLVVIGAGMLMSVDFVGALGIAILIFGLCKVFMEA